MNLACFVMLAAISAFQMGDEVHGGSSIAGEPEVKCCKSAALHETVHQQRHSWPFGK
jgi:hypothetical protein